MLRLVRAVLPEDYRKKWNEKMNDFFYLYKDGVKLRDTLYRLGGLSYQSDLKKDYFMLLKHVEAYYEDWIVEKTGSDPKHLESQWCILNKDGEEVVNFKQFDSPYLVGGVVYSVNRAYHNILTGELYCKCSSSMATSEYIFLDNSYDSDKEKRGVLQICKADGTSKLWKE